MININMYKLANKYFNEFINNSFDINDEKIAHKVKHTYHVVNNAKIFAKSLI